MYEVEVSKSGGSEAAYTRKLKQLYSQALSLTDRQVLHGHCICQADTSRPRAVHLAIVQGTAYYFST